MNFIDTHAHLYLPEFDTDRDQIIERALESNVNKIILPNIDQKTLANVISMSTKYPGICFPSFGLHPCDAKSDFESILAAMEIHLSDTQFVAIGETGTDAYWDTSFWNEQVKAFSIQLEWAKNSNRPIIIHSRETIPQNIEFVRNHQNGNLRGVFHCFTGTFEEAQQIIDLGFHLGIGGVLTYKTSELKSILPKLSLKHLILETDAPFLTPVPYRGKRNESSYIPLIAQKLSEILEISIEDIAQQTSANANSLFKIDQID
ncbi:MAG: TatD family hydrolase [Saprospiraceae bacterium]